MWKFVFFICLTVLFACCRKNNNSGNCNACTDSIVIVPVVDKYKPLFHFSPDNNWINDPNGLLYSNGQYHLFYQYNPYGVVWGHMSWGHSTSTDLMHWSKKPIALLEEPANNKMIFSGSAVNDQNNSSGFGTVTQNAMIAIYTASSPNLQTQDLAYSNDNGISWTKYNGNPVLNINSAEFRDPKVFWYAAQSKWIMVVAKPERHEAWFYESTNLKNWNLMSKWGNAGDVNRAWECPDLFEMNVEGSSEKKWILVVSAGHPQNSYVGMQYFIGDFNGNTFTPVNSYVNPVYLDFGKDYYAAISFNDAPANRRIMIGWANNWEYANNIPTGNVWRGMYAIPRELTLKKNGSKYELYQQPVAELNSLRRDLFTTADQSVNAAFDLSFKGNTYEMELTIEPGTASSAGIKILKSAAEETIIKYDNVNHELMIDRTKSGNVVFSSRFPSIEKVPVALQAGALKLRILVDKSIVEIFANDGQVTLADLVFPLESAGGIQLFSEGGPSVFKSIKIWQIKL